MFLTVPLLMHVIINNYKLKFGQTSQNNVLQCKNTDKCLNGVYQDIMEISFIVFQIK